MARKHGVMWSILIGWWLYPIYLVLIGWWWIPLKKLIDRKKSPLCRLCSSISSALLLGEKT